MLMSLPIGSKLNSQLSQCLIANLYSVFAGRRGAAGGQIFKPSTSFISSLLEESS